MFDHAGILQGHGRKQEPAASSNATFSVMNVSEHEIEVPGGRLYAKSWNPALIGGVKNNPIVLLHDSLGSVEMWRDFPNRLAESTGRLVLAYDRLGFGKSTRREARPSIHFIREEAATSLPAIFDFLEKTFGSEKSVLFGHSVGGAMAVIAAATLGPRVESLITESSQAFIEERTRDGIRKAKVDFADPKIFAKLERFHGDNTAWALDAWIEVWLAENFANWSLQSDLADLKVQVTCPTLAIHGDLDEYGSAEFPKTIASLTTGPSHLEVLSGVGHVPHRERPDEILKLVTEFLQS